MRSVRGARRPSGSVMSSTAGPSGGANGAEVVTDAVRAVGVRRAARVAEHPDHGGDALGGGHEQAAREGDAQHSLGVERGEKDGLGVQGHVPVAGRESPGAEESPARRLGDDVRLAGVRGALDERGARRVEDDLLDVVGERESAELAVHAHPRGDSHHAHGDGTGQMLADGVTDEREGRPLE